MGKPLRDQAGLWTKGEFDIADAPNPHGLLFEHIKSLATLSVAFLGLSVGFSDKLTEIAHFPSAPYLLGAVWGLLVISIVLVLLASLGLHRYLLKAPAPGDTVAEKRYRHGYNVTATQVGFSGIALAVAACTFAVFGALILVTPPNAVDAQAAMRRASTVAAGLPQLKGAKLSVASLSYDRDARVYRVIVTNEDSDRYLVVIAKVDGEAIRVRKLSRGSCGDDPLN